MTMKKMHRLPFYGSYSMILAFVMLANWYFVVPVFMGGTLEVGTLQVSWTRGMEFFSWQHELVFIVASIGMTTVISGLVHAFVKHWFGDSILFYSK
jgi:hypothetical protein